MSTETRRRPNGENWTIDQFRDALEVAEAQLGKINAPTTQRTGCFVQVTGLAPVFTKTETVSVKKRTCNRHDDCDAADIRQRTVGPKDYYGRPVHDTADHCHDECCDECFGN